MLKSTLFIIIFIASSLRAEFDYTVQNSNFTVSQGPSVADVKKNYIYNYNRLRLDLDYSDSKYFVKTIADAINYFGNEYIDSLYFSFLKQVKSDTPFDTQTSFHDYKKGSVYAKIYRLYGGYEDNENLTIAGLQNITMGVGRLWTPTNLFNAKNIYALESDEVFGVSAISYTRHLNDTSKATLVSSIKEDKTLKYAARYKTFLEYGDVAVNFVYSDTTKMLGYELEGNLGDTGIELRSEGAYIISKLKTNEEEVDFFQGILGADYGFVNGVSIVLEALYSSQKFSYQEISSNLNSDILSNLKYSSFYTGTTVFYSFNIFLDASLLYIESFNEKNSRFISPSLTYTLNDYNSFILGAMIENGDKESEFKSRKYDTYYFKYQLAF